MSSTDIVLHRLPGPRLSRRGVPDHDVRSPRAARARSWTDPPPAMRCAPAAWTLAAGRWRPSSPPSSRRRGGPRLKQSEFPTALGDHRAGWRGFRNAAARSRLKTHVERVLLDDHRRREGVKLRSGAEVRARRAPPPASRPRAATTSSTPRRVPPRSRSCTCTWASAPTASTWRLWAGTTSSFDGETRPIDEAAPRVHDGDRHGVGASAAPDSLAANAYTMEPHARRRRRPRTRGASASRGAKLYEALERIDPGRPRARRVGDDRGPLTHEPDRPGDLGPGPGGSHRVEQPAMFPGCPATGIKG